MKNCSTFVSVEAQKMSNTQSLKRTLGATMGKRKDNLGNFVRQNLALVLSTITLLLTFVVGLAGFFIYFENRLNNLDSRLSNIEGQNAVLKGIVESRIATEIVTISQTTTLVSISPGVPGFPIMSIFFGIVIGLVVVALIRTRKGRRAKRGSLRCRLY